MAELKKCCDRDVFRALVLEPVNKRSFSLLNGKHTVILGMRFTERFPNWYRDMVRSFELSEHSLWEHNQGTIFCAGLALKEDEAIYNIVL